MNIRWLYRLTYLYLLLPFILFVLGWFRLFLALPIAAFMLWVVWRLWSQARADETKSNSARITPYLLLLTGIWILLSGVGGYAFQNWDHHWRNAVFHDLINFDWPVYYSQPERGPIKMLVYYVGYWLPAAWTGKFLGWKFANFMLFLWTWLGVILVTLHLSLRLKTSAVKATLLLILFSGMDVLGALFCAQDYPSLWPAVQHLEIWGGNLQYSSFTTQLFWVFNQAVPAWLCISIFVTLSETKALQQRDGDSALPAVAPNDIVGKLVIVWALCFFFAPLASLGLLPYLLIEWLKKVNVAVTTKKESTWISVPKGFLKTLRFDLLLAAIFIVILSSFFFSSNTAAQERGLQSLALKNVLVFFLLEGGILWLLLAPRLWRDPRWAVTGILLFAIPFVQFGSGRDFVMRTSIAPLFTLMVWAGDVIFQNAMPRFSRIAITAVLILGALTPFYEINRSAYRTFEYYFLLSEDQRAQPNTERVTHLEQAIAPETEHPGALVADDIQTLNFMSDELSKNFIANVRRTLYYRYIAPH